MFGPDAAGYKKRACREGLLGHRAPRLGHDSAQALWLDMKGPSSAIRTGYWG